MNIAFLRAMRVASVLALALVFATAIGVSAAPVAQSDIRDFTLHNHTSWDFMHVHVSPAYSDSWGPDILGTDVLSAGQDLDVHFPGALETCSYDIKVDGFGDQSGEMYNVDLCTTRSVEFTDANAI